MAEHGGPARTTPRVLVAGIGNIFLSDDGFGVEVARRLTASARPEGVTVGDFGIRGIHLAFEILDGGYDEVVIVDAYAHGAAPGTIVVFEPDTDRAIGDPSADGHSLDPASVLRLVRRLGGSLPRIVVVGCEPATVDEGIELSAPVAAAIDDAVRAVMEVVPACCAAFDETCVRTQLATTEDAEDTEVRSPGNAVLSSVSSASSVVES